jgi:hypothetical protein
MVELVGVGHALARAKAGLVGDHEERLGLSVVHADDLIAQQAQLDLDQIVGRLEQAEQDEFLLVGLTLVGQVIALELVSQVRGERTMVEQFQFRLGECLEAADLRDLTLDGAQRGCIRRGRADRRVVLRAGWRGHEQ